MNINKSEIVVEAIRTSGPLLCKTGVENAYRRAFLDGVGASSKEKTWDQIRHTHSCCGSRVCWRHKV